MSLVGSLEDLSLGDILQIISLSRKSGVLALKTSGNEGRIVFADGLVRGAAVNDGPQGLRDVLAAGGFLDDESLDAAEAYADARGCPLPEAVAETSSLSPERIDSVCREAIESAVLAMFTWSKGDFSFDVRGEPAPGDPELLAPSGVNAQYLAMEGARIRDEGGSEETGAPAEGGEADASDDDDVTGSGFDEMSAHELFGVTPDVDPEQTQPSPPAEEAVDTVAMAAVERNDPPVAGLSDRATQLAAEIMALGEVVGESSGADDSDTADLVPPEDGWGDAEELDLDAPSEPVPQASDASEALSVAPSEDAEPADLFGSDSLEWDDDALDADGHAEVTELDLPAEVAPEPVAEPADAQTQPRVAVSSSPAPGKGSGRALVVVDHDLVALEWIKQALEATYQPIHIFQQTEQALARIRQYLVRGEPPVVLVAPGVAIDRLGGTRDVVDFVERLKAQSPRLLVLWLREDGALPVARHGRADGTVVRPDGNRLRATRAPEQLAAESAEFARQVDEAASSTPAEEGPRAPGKDISPDALQRLRDATKALTAASSRGEVLPLVIEFASEVLGRVAMFMVRDESAIGMAQRGLGLCGGPDDAALRDLGFPCKASAWMMQVLEDARPVRGAPGNDGDRQLCDLLGDRIPSEVYMAPIESTGQVIALIYGDNLPEDGPIGDTSALEVVLHHAGLALDRAALERALRDEPA